MKIRILVQEHLCVITNLFCSTSQGMMFPQVKCVCGGDWI